jgi:UPF0271 protein
VREAFADRGYTAEGGLVPRSRPGAVITDPTVITERVRRLVTAGEIVAEDGTVVPVIAESICVHGDTPGAVAIAQVVRTAIETAGVAVRPFVRAGA